MKKIAIASAAALVSATNAFAADLPRRALAPIAPVVLPTFSWTGFYAGLNAGAGWSSDTAKSRSVLDADFDPILRLYKLDTVKNKSNGFVGGGQVGYNYQFNPGGGLVVGAEADIQYAGLQRKRHWTSDHVYNYTDGDLSNHGDITSRTGLDFLGTVRGRLGYGVDRVFVYGTGGLAYGQATYRNRFVIDYAFTPNATSTTPATAGQNAYTIGKDGMQTGYAYGGGIEYALPTDSFLNLLRSSAVTLKAEYLHYDLGARNITQFDRSGKSAVYTTKVKSEGDLVRAGLNFKFGL